METAFARIPPRNDRCHAPALVSVQSGTVVAARRALALTSGAVTLRVAKPFVVAPACSRGALGTRRALQERLLADVVARRAVVADEVRAL